MQQRRVGAVLQARKTVRLTQASARSDLLCTCFRLFVACAHARCIVASARLRCKRCSVTFMAEAAMLLHGVAQAALTIRCAAEYVARVSLADAGGMLQCSWSRWAANLDVAGSDDDGSGDIVAWTHDSPSKPRTQRIAASLETPADLGSAGGCVSPPKLPQATYTREQTLQRLTSELSATSPESIELEQCASASDDWAAVALAMVSPMRGACSPERPCGEEALWEPVTGELACSERSNGATGAAAVAAKQQAARGVDALLHQLQQQTSRCTSLAELLQLLPDTPAEPSGQQVDSTQQISMETSQQHVAHPASSIASGASAQRTVLQSRSTSTAKLSEKQNRRVDLASPLVKAAAVEPIGPVSELSRGRIIAVPPTYLFAFPTFESVLVAHAGAGAVRPSLVEGEDHGHLVRMAMRSAAERSGRWCTEQTEHGFASALSAEQTAAQAKLAAEERAAGAIVRMPCDVYALHGFKSRHALCCRLRATLSTSCLQVAVDASSARLQSRSRGGSISYHGIRRSSGGFRWSPTVSTLRLASYFELRSTSSAGSRTRAEALWSLTMTRQAAARCHCGIRLVAATCGTFSGLGARGRTCQTASCSCGRRSTTSHDAGTLRCHRHCRAPSCARPGSRHPCCGYDALRCAA